ncbi:hypothetical protein QBC38DRAFT_489824 [Podospora fimiseda]|uniref:Uncharacterized protein n=1 Tax=Podospora fimiseda TaxID=252190 RepID=A0AAN7BGP9_9PEZI|nr:hypothetical protein QBC38DRAFT_489824 [Podospora fimiseda]
MAALSVNGIGATVDSESTFKFAAANGTGKIYPGGTGSSDLKGWVYFAIPSPLPPYSALNSVTIQFAATNAQVDKVAVWLGNNQVFSADNLQQTDTFTKPIASSQAVYNGSGIAVAVYVVFDGPASKVNFQSVSIGV